MSWLIDPFTSQFTSRAALLCLCIGILAPMVGTWVVLRRIAYIGDAMSHATIGGVAIAYWVAGASSVLIGALGAGVLMAILIALFSVNRRLGQDAVIGVIESMMFAAGVIIIGRLDSNVALSHFLFGQLLAVRTSDVIVSVVLTVLAAAAIALVFNDLRLATFDPMHARQVGVRVRLLDGVLLVLVSVAVVVCLRTVGSLMSLSMLVVPAATARLVTRTTSRMTMVAVACGLLAVFSGFIASYHLDAAPGAAVAIAASLLFVAVYVVSLPRRHHAHGPHPA